MSREEGQWGEMLVAEYLREHNYQLLAHGYHCRFGEIDLIARDKSGVLCFIEVKTRTNLRMGLPREYVTLSKQAKLKKTARFYLAANRLDCVCRFDVAEVYAESGQENARIEYLENAFQ